LQVLERTFGVLELFTAERFEWTTTEVARATGLPIPTAHRILTTLRFHGFVSRDDRTKRFRLGPAALELGERARAVVDLRAVALPVLRRLAQNTGETALLTVLNDAHDRSVCLERVESPQPLRLSVQPGRQLPLHAGASQKILLAYLSDEEIERVLSQPLERLWQATITDPHALRSEIADIRKKAWSKSFEETNAGAWGLAVPILDNEGGIVAGIGLAGPSARLSQKEITEHLGRLRLAAADVSRTLGFASSATARSPANAKAPAVARRRHAKRSARRE
jgi:DNA-binding IclR family transcriptional regulator